MPTFYRTLTVILYTNHVSGPYHIMEGRLCVCTITIPDSVPLWEYSINEKEEAKTVLLKAAPVTSWGSATVRLTERTPTFPSLLLRHVNRHANT